MIEPLEQELGNSTNSEDKPLSLDQGIRLGTWNVNSIRTAEAELYHFLEVEKPDIMMLQETKTIKINLTKDIGAIVGQSARSKNCEDGKYLSGGLATIARKGLLLKVD